MEIEEENIVINSNVNSKIKSLPIDLVFIPQAVQMPFNEKLKLQIAFYRNTKAAKTTPAKYLKNVDNAAPSMPNNYVKLNSQNLAFCTTINFNIETQTFQPKLIKVQLAFEADGKKSIFDSEINLKDFLLLQENFDKNNIQVKFKQQCKLYFGIKAKIVGLNQFKKPSKSIKNLSKSMPKQGLDKKNMVQQNTDKQQEKNDKKLLAQTDMTKPKKQRIIKFELPQQNKKDLQQNQNIDEQFGKQIKSWNIKQQNNNEGVLSQKNKKLSNSSIKFNLKEDQVKQNKSLSNSLKDNLLKKQNEQLKQKIKNLQQKCIQKRVKINDLQGLVKKLQQQLKEAKQKQKQYYNIQEIDNKKSQIIERLNKQLGQIKKINQDYRIKTEQMNKKVSSKQSQVQTLKNNEVLSLKKQLQTKQLTIKKLNEEKNNVIAQLKKQIKDMKQEAQSIKKKDENSLQVKILNEKLRRQCEHTKKNQRSALTQKMQVDSKNKELQEQIINLKESIGKMLNSVQQYGCPELFLKVADCVG